MILAGMMILIWLVCIAFLWNEGTWSNCLTLVNVVFAMLVAWNYWEPAADFMETKMGSFTYVLDYLCVWFIFFLSYIVLRAATDGLSRTQVKFKMPVEQAGRVISVFLIGWLMVCFTLATMHMSPLARTAIRGEFQPEPMANNFLGMAPDRMWLGYVQHRSKNALSSSPTVVFDPESEFIFKYGGRREQFSKHMTVRVNP